MWQPDATTVPNNAGAPGDTQNWISFSTRQQAESWFDKYYPEYGDVARLDSGGDRIARGPCQGTPNP